jgi:hypothetical protein
MSVVDKILNVEAGEVELFQKDGNSGRFDLFKEALYDMGIEDFKEFGKINLYMKRSLATSEKVQRLMRQYGVEMFDPETKNEDVK